jgi:hypothetical protein
MKKTKPKHIIIKFLDTGDKEKRLKAARERQDVAYRGTKLRMAIDFPFETMQENKATFEVLVECNRHFTIVYSVKICFKN